MKLFHSTTAATAQAILASGFKDGTDNYLTMQLHSGVWVSDRPLDENEGASSSEALLMIEIDGRKIRRFEWVGDMGYREWLIPAERLNCANVCLTERIPTK